MAKIVLYSTSVPVTIKTRSDIETIKFLLDALKAEYEEVDLAEEPERREDMQAISGKRTLPQLIVNGKYAGGAKTLQELQDFGELGGVLDGTIEPQPED